MTEPLDNVEDYLIVKVVAITAKDNKKFLNSFSFHNFIFISGEESNVNLLFCDWHIQEMILEPA